MKPYVKPELYFESFELAQHIAACDYKLGINDVTICKITEDRYTDNIAAGGFVSQNICDFPFEIYCYTNGSDDGPRTFMS